MNQEEANYLANQQQQAQMQQAQGRINQLRQSEQETFLEKNEKSLIKEQLDLSEELERINFLLKGYVWDIDLNKWMEPTDDEMVVLTDYGVHLIMNTIQWYINKNTLLSNYDEMTILSKMEDFATALADVVFMEYEKIFKYPSFEDCGKVLTARVDQKIEVQVFSAKLQDKKIEEKDVRKEIIDEMKGRIEMELTKIREQIIKNKLKRFELVIREVQDAVHSTYLRAWNGQERKTLREHVHITETKGMNFNQQQQGGNLNPFTWFGSKKQ